MMLCHSEHIPPIQNTFFANLFSLLQMLSRILRPVIHLTFIVEDWKSTNVLTRRIAESFPMEQYLVHNLEILLNYFNNLRRQFEALVESYDRACDQDLLHESYCQTICVPEYRGRLGRPSMHVTPERLNVLHNETGFRWADVSRILGISERTIRRRRHEFGLAVGRRIEFSEKSDNDLDNHVREILSMKPNSGGRLVEGGLQSRGLHIQRRRIQDSIRRVDLVIRTLRLARTIIRMYSVPSRNVLW